MENKPKAKYFYIAAFKRGNADYEWFFENYAYAITRKTVELSDIVNAMYFADPDIGKTICDYLNVFHADSGYRFAVCEINPRVYFEDDHIYRMEGESTFNFSIEGGENG